MISQDERISAEALEVATRFGETAVTCRVSNGNVILEGIVANDEHHYQIEDAVRSIPGVKAVRNSMMVEGFSAIVANEIEGVELTPDFTAETGTGDSFEAASEAEPYIPPTDPVITTSGRNEDDVEILNGFAVSSEEDDGEADTDGFTVLPGGDEQLRASVIDALARDAATTGLDIEVAVRDGIVTLRGVVQSLEDADSAESVAAYVDGVDEVLEELRVEGIEG